MLSRLSANIMCQYLYLLKTEHVYLSRSVFVLIETRIGLVIVWVAPRLDDMETIYSSALGHRQLFTNDQAAFESSGSPQSFLIPTSIS
jgi:hypothetical protein